MARLWRAKGSAMSARAKTGQLGSAGVSHAKPRVSHLRVEGLRARLVRIRIHRIIGFSGFFRRASSPGKRLSDAAKSASWARRNPENPDSDKAAQSPACIPLDSGIRRNDENRNLSKPINGLGIYRSQFSFGFGWTPLEMRNFANDG